MAQQSIKQMAEKMTAMYNIVQATEKIMPTSTRRREATDKLKKTNASKRARKANASKRSSIIVKTLQAGGMQF